jgi:putative heme-binding domain-containing protein
VEALARVPDPRSLEAYAWGLSGTNPALQEQCAAAVEHVKREHPGTAVTLPPPPARSDLQRYFEHGVARRGDPERGRALFEDVRGVACAKCHRVRGKGGEVGPDLSSAGAQFSRAELAEHVLWPSRKIREGYGLVKIRTTSGDILAGAVKEETPVRLVLVDAEGRRHELPKAEIEARLTGELSLMPEGLERGLTLDQFSDLLDFLQTLK